MYLTGFTLFLSLILNRTYVMILDVLRLEDEVKQMKGEGGPKGSIAAKMGNAGEPGEIARLKKQLSEKDKDMETFKKQVKSQQDEYNRMGDQVSGSDSAPKKDR